MHYMCFLMTTRVIHASLAPPSALANYSHFICIVSTVQADLMVLMPEVMSVRWVITACQGPGPNISIHVQLEP